MTLDAASSAAKELLAGVNSNTYHATSNPLGLAGLGYKTVIPAAYNAMATLSTAMVAEANVAVSSTLLNSSVTTSSSSNTIGTGTKSFAVQTGKSFPIGMIARATDVSDTANYVSGAVQSYDSGTGVLVIDATATGGSGTIASWSIFPDNSSSGGDVVGNTTSTDNALTRYHGTDGKVIQSSAISVDDAGIMSGVARVLAANGTAALPSYGFGTDLDTGFYLSATGTIAISIGGSQYATWSSSGFDWKDKIFKRAELRDYSETVVSQTSGATYAADYSAAPIHNITLDQDITLSFANPSKPGTMTNLSFIITQDATGGWDVTFPGGAVGAADFIMPQGAGDKVVFGAWTIDEGATWYLTDAKEYLA